MPPMAFQGIVTKAGYMNKTVTVTVSRWVIHKLTGKRVERSRKFLVHDENNVSREEDLVTIRNCPPKSALKRFKLETVLKSPQGEREAARTARLAAEKASSDATPVTKGSSVLEALKQSRPTA
ncbi:hypothetical protein D9619_003000 [Psilocybe cf. subviscida]|uniref:Nucleic acid-binding protein n=1 Tax=Psilocybe cf. subviscida TaxID=2480587 RepID=A0A8H5EU96_9AGAR|nr:hypothetical protein D9619_003000 [Psilocybe cf. subviscida]